jgi:uncharacterized protein with PIN domain
MSLLKMLTGLDATYSHAVKDCPRCHGAIKEDEPSFPGDTSHYDTYTCQSCGHYFYAADNY